MPANTSPDNIEYPVSTDPVAPLETVFANMANSIQDGFDGFRTDWNGFTATRAIQTFRWANDAARTAQTGMTAGDIGYQTDTTTFHLYNGSAWIPWASPPIQRTTGIMNNVTVGNGTLTSYYQYVNGRIREFGRFILGSTSSVTGNIFFNTARSMSSTFYGTRQTVVGGSAYLERVGIAPYPLTPFAVSTTSVQFQAHVVSGSNVVGSIVNASTPGSWASTYCLSWDFTYTPA